MAGAGPWPGRAPRPGAVAARPRLLLLLSAGALAPRPAAGVLDAPGGARADPRRREGLVALQVDAGGGLSNDGGGGANGSGAEAPPPGAAVALSATAHSGAAAGVVRREPRRGWAVHLEEGRAARPLGSTPWAARRPVALEDRSNGSNAGSLACHSSTYAPKEGCPASCPYAAQDGEAPCHFYCVAKSECGQFPTMNGEEVADKEMKVCRQCQVDGCEKCAAGGEDHCNVCESGYELDPTTLQCISTGVKLHLPAVGAGAILALVVLLLIWYVDLLRRPPDNSEILKKALEQRDQLKIRDEGREERPALPMWEGCWWKTSVHEDLRAGGPGFLLHMDFQLFLLAWASCATLGWLLFGLVEPTAFTIGLRETTTSLELCSAVHNGRLERDALLEGKTLFVGIFYVASVAAFLAFAARQQRKFVRLDDGDDSLMDYAAFCKGFPAGDKGAGIEEEYEAFFKQVLGEDLIGVSVCWDREDPATATELQSLIETEEETRELAPGTRLLLPEGPDEPPTLLARLEAYLGLDAALKVGVVQEVVEPVRQPGEASAVGDDSNRRGLLEEVPTAGACYVVCRTQGATKRLFDAFDSPDAPRFRADPATPGSGSIVHCKSVSAEPCSVRWEAYRTAERTRFQRIMWGCVAILGVMALWATLFYLPYAYYTYKQYKATGHDVSNSAAFFFTVLVLLGNEAMLAMCGCVAEMVRPKMVDEMERFYMVSYTMATLLNMILDLGVILFCTYFGMVARNVRNDEGVLIGDLKTLEAIAESFPIQKFGGEMLYFYNVFGCFIIPLLAQPLVCIFLPWHIGGLLVRSKKVPFKQAVAVMTPAPFDLARYSEHVVNATLLVCSLFLASGYVLYSMVGLIVGFGLSYLYDRVRALRYMGWFRYSTDIVDISAHRLLVLPCATLAACLVFQLRLMRSFGLSDGWTIPMIMFAFAGHSLLHFSVLEWIFRSKREKKVKEEQPTYEEVAKLEAVDWFTSNKVHCLRMKYVSKGRPGLAGQAVTWPAPGQVRARRGTPAQAAGPPPAVDAEGNDPDGEAGTGGTGSAASAPGAAAVSATRESGGSGDCVAVPGGPSAAAAGGGDAAAPTAAAGAEGAGGSGE